MPSFQISLTPHKRVAGRFIDSVRRALQKALAEERNSRGLTQAAIAAELGVNRSVIHRQIIGHENLTLASVGEISAALGRYPKFELVRLDELLGGNHVAPATESSKLQPIPMMQNRDANITVYSGASFEAVAS